MKLAIHHRPRSFSEKWLVYCDKHGVDYKIVNCYKSNVIDQLQDCFGLMWHWSHTDHKAALFARQLTISLEMRGKKVFPDFKTCWHFDDKIGQKYLLESINAPLVPTHIFYDTSSAKEWANHTDYPKVFKLSKGAGSLNVRLVENKEQLIKLIDRAFKHGFPSIDILEKFNDRRKIFLHKMNFQNLNSLLRSVFLLIALPFNKYISLLEYQKGYVYIQKFVPNNDYDIRVIVIGKRAFAIKRKVRDYDFRASGSGKILYDPENIPTECIKLAFDINQDLKMQCAAFDFVFSGNQIFLLEISYGFKSSGYEECPGYWDNDINWIAGRFTPEWFIIEDFLLNAKN